MKTNYLLVVLSASILTHSALASAKHQPDWSSPWVDLSRAKAGPPEPKPSLSWMGSVKAGAIWISGGDDQTFFLAPGIQKTYTAEDSSNSLSNIGILLGIQKTLAPTMQAQLGLAWVSTGTANLNGVIWDDADPQFDNYTYNYRLQHSHLAIEGKLLAEVGLIITPWINGSIGVGFNRANSFTNKPTVCGALPNPNFASNTATSFTYSIGAGIQREFNNHWQVGIGYEFADWGKSELGRATGQTLNTGISLSNMYTNGILLNITYVA